VLKGRHKLVCGHMSRSFPDVNTWVNFLEMKSFFDDVLEDNMVGDMSFRTI
jgi:hypothetical protein